MSNPNYFVVKCLEEALEKARSGEIQGIALVLHNQSGPKGASYCGNVHPYVQAKMSSMMNDIAFGIEKIRFED